MGNNISDNQNAVTPTVETLSGKGGNSSLDSSDELMIDDVLKELEAKNTQDSNEIGSQIQRSNKDEKKETGEDPLIVKEASTKEDIEQKSKEDKNENVLKEKKSVTKTKESVPFDEKQTKDETANKKLFESLKKARSEYEKQGQSSDEKTIVGATAIITYLKWVEESQNILRDLETTEQRKKVLDLIPKRIREQLRQGTLILRSSVENSGTQKECVEEKLQKRIRRIDERIKELNKKKSEYLEELVPLETKKFLVKEELKNKPSESSLGTDNEQSEQTKSTQDLISKPFFKNKAPVIDPKKEERTRLQRAQVAEKTEKKEPRTEKDDLLGKTILDSSESQKDISHTKPSIQKEDTNINDDETKNQGITEKEEPVVQDNQKTHLNDPEEEKESAFQDKEEPVHYSDEQLKEAAELRKDFYKKLSSIDSSEWYQSPSKNRDYVNKKIIQVAGILSGKTPNQIDMNDIQTARLFVFNGAPHSVLKHPAFSYVESFYNYQSFQGCTGINPEKASDGSPASTQKQSSIKSPFAKKVMADV